MNDRCSSRTSVNLEKIRLELHGHNLCDLGKNCAILLERPVNHHPTTEEYILTPTLCDPRCAVAIMDSRVIGMFSYSMQGCLLAASGTEVSPKYRKIGIARSLWDLAIRTERPISVYVGVCTDRGMTLVNSVHRIHNRKHWVVYDDGRRKLRVIGKPRDEHLAVRRKERSLAI